jgi:hypothetical protein
MSDLPQTDDRHPADVVTAMVDQVLKLAETWTAWDGEPRPIDDRVYTPHKAIRRVADHLIDHLAEIEARLAGVPTIPDLWHASATTTPADLAPFTPDDLDESRSRPTRLAQVLDVPLRALTDGEPDQHGPRCLVTSADRVPPRRIALLRQRRGQPARLLGKSS